MDVTHIISDFYAICGAGRIGEITGVHVSINSVDRLLEMVNCPECLDSYQRMKDRSNPSPVETLDKIIAHVEVGQHALEAAMERITGLEELIRKAHGPEGCECFKGTWPPGIVCEAHRDLKAMAQELQESKNDAEASQYDENA